MAGFRELVPDLPHFDEDVFEAEASVSYLVQQHEKQETEAGLEAWLCNDKFYAQCCAWVKRKADQAQACFDQPKEVRAAMATHPKHILQARRPRLRH